MKVIRLISGRRYQEDRHERECERKIVLSDGLSLAWDHCILATGCEARKLQTPGADLKGVVTPALVRR